MTHSCNPIVLSLRRPPEADAAGGEARLKSVTSDLLSVVKAALRPERVSNDRRQEKQTPDRIIVLPEAAGEADWPMGFGRSDAFGWRMIRTEPWVFLPGCKAPLGPAS